MQQETKNENKIHIEVKKINKQSRKIEWTETLEIPYEINENLSKEDKEIIEANYINKDNEKVFVKDPNPLLNTSVLEMEANPFHQPSMNTIEFNFEEEESIVLTNISKNNNEQVTKEEELIALQKLFENNIISKKEYEEKIKLIEQQTNN